MAEGLLSRNPKVEFEYGGVQYRWTRPPLYDAQFEALFSCPDPEGKTARYGICEASTKAGKTVGCMAWLAEQAITSKGDGREFWWVAPVYKQAQIAYSRMKRAIPPWTIARTNDAENVIVLFNGAIVRFRSAEKPDNLYGEDVYAAVVDEASRMREAAWHAVRSTLTATRGPVRIIGNVKGRGNWFYKLSRKAQMGAKDHAYRKITAYDAIAGGVLDPEEIADAKASLPEAVFKELYLAEGSEDGENPFGLTNIAACQSNVLSDERTVVIGADLGDTKDFTVVVGMDKYGNVTGIERWNKTGWPFTKQRLIKIIGKTPALIDSTGLGSPIVDDIKAACRNAEGYVFSTRSKQHLMEGLALALQGREVTIFNPGHGPGKTLVEELEIFEYVHTRTATLYSAPEGFHDDCVMALALAVEMLRRTYPTSQAPVKPGSVSKAMPWFGAAQGGDDGRQTDD